MVIPGTHIYLSAQADSPSYRMHSLPSQNQQLALDMSCWGAARYNPLCILQQKQPTAVAKQLLHHASQGPHLGSRGVPVDHRLVLDAPRPVGIPQGVERLLPVDVCWAHARNHDSAAVATK